MDYGSAAAEGQLLHGAARTSFFFGVDHATSPRDIAARARGILSSRQKRVSSDSTLNLPQRGEHILIPVHLFELIRNKFQRMVHPQHQRWNRYYPTAVLLHRQEPITLQSRGPNREASSTIEAVANDDDDEDLARSCLGCGFSSISHCPLTHNTAARSNVSAF